MRLIPYRRMQFDVPLRQDEVMATLRGAIKTWQGPRFPPHADDGSFEGSVSHDAFKVNRRINYRNSFLPILLGRVHAQPNGTRIDVTLRPPLFSLVFLSVWSAGLSSATVLIYCKTLGRGTFSLALLGPVAMVLFGYSIMLYGFALEADRSERMLRELLSRGP